MSNRTVLDTTEPYNDEETAPEDAYPLSFQVRLQFSLLVTIQIFLSRLLLVNSLNLLGTWISAGIY